MENGRIAVPSMQAGGLDGKRSGHFGHCDTFTLVDVKDGTIEKVSTVANQSHVQGGCMVPVNLLAAHKVGALVAGGMGMRPLEGFSQVGIAVFHNLGLATVRQAVEAFARLGWLTTGYKKKVDSILPSGFVQDKSGKIIKLGNA